MAKALQQILGYENLIGMIANPQGGIPDDILPTGFSSLTKPVSGNYAKWHVTTNTRSVARTNAYGAAAKMRDKQAITARSAVLLHSYESMNHELTTLMALRNFDDPNLQSLGEQEVDAQTIEFKRLFTNLRGAAIMSAIVNGKIYLDANGNLLPSSSGAIMTIDLGVPANNKNQLNGIIDKTWTDATADIIGMIGKICALQRQLTGLPIRYAFYGSAVPGYIMGNTNVQKLLPGNSQLSTALMSGSIPAGFGTADGTLSAKRGIVWIPAYEGFFKDDSGTNQVQFPVDAVVFTPEPDPSWYRLLEGSFPVPKLLSAPSDPTEALNNIEIVNGLFSYAQIGYNPPSIQHYAGDTFLPTFLRPEAVLQADVNF